MRIFTLLLLVIVCSGCSPKHESKPSGANMFDVPGLAINKDNHPSVENESKAMQKFLVGKLSSNQNNKKTALKNLTDSSNLLENPPTTITKSIAELLLQQGKPEEALKKVDEGLLKNKNDKDLLLYKVGILEVLGKLDDSIRCLEQVIELHPQDEKLYLLGASLYLKVNRPDDSIRFLNMATKLPVDTSESQSLLAKILYAVEKYDESAKLYEALIKKKPSQSIFLVELSKVKIRQKKTSEAKKLLKKALLINKRDVLARKILAGISASEGKGKEAKNLLRDALLIDDKENDARINLALLEIKDAQYDAALNELNLLLIASPQNDIALFTRATTLSAIGRKEEAIQDVRKIPESSSLYEKSQILIFLLSKEKGDYVSAYDSIKKAYSLSSEKKSLLGSYLQTLEILDKNEEAIEVLQSIREDKNYDSEIEFLYGVVLDRADRRDEAFNIISRVISKDPNHALSLNYLAFVLAEQGDQLSEAEAYCTRALEKEPQNPYFLDTFGWIRFKQGRSSDALLIIERALVFAPEDADILEHQAIILASIGESARAKESFEKALLFLGNNEEKKKLITKKIEALSE